MMETRCRRIFPDKNVSAFRSLYRGHWCGTKIILVLVNVLLLGISGWAEDLATRYEADTILAFLRSNHELENDSTLNARQRAAIKSRLYSALQLGDSDFRQIDRTYLSLLPGLKSIEERGREYVRAELDRGRRPDAEVIQGFVAERERFLQARFQTLRQSLGQKAWDALIAYTRANFTLSDGGPR